MLRTPSQSWFERPTGTRIVEPCECYFTSKLYNNRMTDLGNDVDMWPPTVHAHIRAGPGIGSKDRRDLDIWNISDGRRERNTLKPR